MTRRLRKPPGDVHVLQPMIDRMIQDWHLLSPAKARALAALAAMLVLAQIGQPYPSTAWLHHLPTALLLVATPALLRRWPLSDGTVVAVVLFLALHTLGGRWTYSNLPYDDWARMLTGATISETFGWQRNHYDRLVHFAFGLLLYAPVRELALRYGRTGPILAGSIAIGFVVAVGGLYEIVEWLLTLTAPADVAGDYNGQQGDLWDAQKDMALALLGALLAALWLRVRTRPG